VVTSKPLDLHGQRTKLRAAVTPRGCGGHEGVGPRSQIFKRKRTSTLPAAAKLLTKDEAGGLRRILLSYRCFCSEARSRGQRVVRLFLWCVVFGCCLCVLQAGATEDKTLRGPGAQTCGEFAFDLRVNRNTENTYFDWAEGFISGMNWADAINDHTAKNIMALSVADQKQVIRDYCNEHPLASYVEAVLDLYNRLPTSDFHKQNSH
jgi:hypothetical protein